MSLREVAFDISFTGNATQLLNVNNAVNNLIRRTRVGSENMDRLGQAARDRLGSARERMGGLGRETDNTNRRLASFTRDMRNFLSNTRIVQNFSRIGQAARQHLGNGISQSTNFARSSIRTLGEFTRNTFNRVFPDTSRRGRILRGVFNDIGRAGRRAFTNIRNYINSVNSSTSNLSNRLNQLSVKLDAIAAKSGRIGNSLMMKVTLPFALAGGKIIKTAANFQSAMSEVQAISGANAQEFELLRKKAREMGATTQFSATQSAEALKYMAMAGWDTNKMIDALPGVMNLAAASGEDLGTVSDIVTDSMTAFGLKADQATRFADVLAQASSKSNTQVSKMGETFKYVAPVAGALKYSVEDTAIAVGLMANAGIKSSQAGTSLRGALTNLVKPTAKMQSAMDELGISITDSQGNMKPFKTVMDDMRKGFSGLTEDQKTFYAATIFGEQSMSGMLGIINATEEDYSKLSKSIYESSEAAKRQAEIMNDNLKGDFLKFKSAVEEISLQIGDLLIPHLRKGVQYVTGFVNKIGALDDKTKLTILKVIGLAMALGPMFKLFQFGTLGVSSFVKVLSFLAKNNLFTGIFTGLKYIKGGFLAIKGLGIKGMLLGIKSGFIYLGTTILPVIATIGLLVAAGYMLYKNWDMVKAKGIEFINSLKEKFSVFVPDAIALWDNLKESFIRLLPIFGGVVGGILGGLGSMLKTIVVIVGNVIKVFKGITDFLLGVFTGDWSRAWEGIKSIFTGIIDAIKGIFQGVIDFFGSVLGGFIEGVEVGKSTAEKAKNSVGAKKSNQNSISVVQREIPQFAKGVHNFGGGLALVGEQGPELVTLPKGSSVTTATKTKSIINDGFSNISYDIYDNSPTGKASRNISVVFAPEIHVSANTAQDAKEIAEVSKNTIKSYFDEWVDEALYVS